MLTKHARTVRDTSFIVICLLLVGCGHDFYRQRADVIQAHAEAFQTNLKANRVAAAIHENEEIEAVASQVADAIRKRSQPLAPNQKDHEWVLLKAAIDAAIGNWLALGRHLTMNKQYDQARAAYQRVIDTYTGEPEQPYRERAARAKRDIDILNPPTVSSSAPGL